MAGPPTVTDDLIAYIEDTYAESGSAYASGNRVVVLSEGISGIARRFGVSTGTIKNCFVYLEKTGYIISRSGSYLLISPEFLTPEKRGDDEEDWDHEASASAWERRMDEDTVRSIVRELVRDRGQKDAMLYVRAHRQWCWVNSLTPWL